MPATLKSRMPAIIAGLDPKMNAAIHAGAEVIAASAKEKAPDAPPLGEGLVEAIHVESEGGESYVLTDWKAHFLEFGTTHSAPQPFLIPAAEESKAEVVSLATLALRAL